MKHARKTATSWLAILALLCFISQAADAQQCKAGASPCRETAPGGALLKSAAGIWTVKCKGPDELATSPNTSPPRLDKICEQISACPAAGGFGKFLQAVTFDCKSKQFDGYFGLDGMTFGILDWTGNDLPIVMEFYQKRNKDKFNEMFGALNLPIKDGCLDTAWACNQNKLGKLTCDRNFNAAFALSLRTPDFQKAQVDYALAQYERRLKRFEDLGLKTEYGNTAMAVVANNLKSKAACKPAAWKKACAGKPDETKLVACMLERYAANECRGGHPGAAKKRADAINAVFANAKPSENIHPAVADVVACSDKWGTSGN